MHIAHPGGMLRVPHTRLFHGLTGTCLSEHGSAAYYAAALRLDRSRHTKHQGHQHVYTFNIDGAVRFAKINSFSTIQIENNHGDLCINASVFIQSRVVKSVFSVQGRYYP